MFLKVYFLYFFYTFVTIMSSLLAYLSETEIEAGCDEAGRGCLAGGVFAAAVILPKDFYHYVSYTYHAQFQKSKYIRHVKMSFKKEEDAKNFCKELERRFLYCVERGDFN